MVGKYTFRLPLGDDSWNVYSRKREREREKQREKEREKKRERERERENPRRCKTSSVGQSARLSFPRSSVRFRQKLKKPKTQMI